MTFKLVPSALIRKEIIHQLYISIETVKKERFDEYQRSRSRQSVEEYIAYQKCLFFMDYAFNRIKEPNRDFYRGRTIFLLLDFLEVEMNHCFHAKHYQSQISYEIHLEIYKDVSKIIKDVFVNRNHLRKQELIHWETTKIKGVALV